MGSGRNIKALRDKFDLTQEQLADKIGVTRESIVRWESDKMAVRDRHIAKMIELFGIEPEDIKSDAYGLHAQLYDDAMRPKANGVRPVKGMEMGYVPLRGKVHAGKPVEAELYEDEMALIPQFLLDQDPECWASKSEGDCMNNVYPEGAIYVISPNKPHQNGKPEVWTIDGVDTVARRVYQTADTLLLSPDSTNPENKDIVIRAEDGHTAHYDGAIVWFQPDGEVR